MTTEEIKQLLEKYWVCETSLEEELALKSFFSSDSVPEELTKYQPLFLWETKQQQVKRQNRTKTVRNAPPDVQWYAFLKIAASVLLALTLGMGIYTHYQQRKYLDAVFSETYSNPEDALQETKNVIGKISSVLNLAKDRNEELQKIDSMEHIPANKLVE